MVSAYQFVVGGLGILLGLAWIVAPVRMNRYQNRLRFFRSTETDLERMEKRAFIGRLGGVVLAFLGAAFLVGVIP